MNTTPKAPWLHSPLFDLTFLIAPLYLSCFVVLAGSKHIETYEVTPWLWLAIVVGIDVTHVYATLYRTYFDRGVLQRAPLLLYGVPLVAFSVSIMLYSIKPIAFWRMLAYLAVFHFVRQQYGFVRLYSGTQHSTFSQPWFRRLESATLYVTMLYPLIYWHTREPREFSWLIEGDFVPLMLPWLETSAHFIYLGLLGVYSLVLIGALAYKGHYNIPKTLLIYGTALSWHLGIVTYNSDWAFTITNVISHGVPYLALVWLVKNRELLQTSMPTSTLLKAILRPRWVLGFVAVPALFAYCEEYLWDALVWAEHAELFPNQDFLPNLVHSPLMLRVVPLLALPQMTHYLLDAFIWRRSMRYT